MEARALHGGRKIRLEADLSVPLAHRKFGRYQEALEAIEQIVTETPNHLAAWVALVDLALTDLNDPERARLALHRGFKALTDPADRAALAAAHRTVSQRVQRRTARAELEKPEVLDFPDAPE